MNTKHGFKLTSLEKNWILYDVGNSAYIMLISTIFPIYFDYLTESSGLSSEYSLIYWGYATSIVTLIVALTGPILGAIADNRKMKKQFLAMSTLIGVFSCFVLGFINSWLSFLVIFALGKIGCSLALIFYDSMLTDVTTQKRIDNISAQGYAYGYIGSCIPFIISLVFIIFPEVLGLSFNQGVIISFSINGFWWVIMTLPIIKSYVQSDTNLKKSEISKVFLNLFETVKELSQNKKVFLFLIAFFFYMDGVYTIIDMATVYATALGLDTTLLLVALLITQIVAFPFAILCGRLSQKYLTEKLLLICIGAYIFIAIYAIFLKTQSQFFVLAVFVGIFQGGVQSLSRSYFGKIIPKDKTGEYYGILDIFGKGASFLGTTLVSFIAQVTGNLNIGVSVITPLIIIGFFLFKKSVKYE